MFAPAFAREVRRLDTGHRATLSDALRQLSTAADAAVAGENDPWPRSLRIKKVQGTRGVWEMTWSMRDPDGRLTWEWTTSDGAPTILLRRVGGHDILKRP